MSLLCPVVLGYIFNTENDDTGYRTGQEFHVEYILNQFLSETFALGLQGDFNVGDESRTRVPV